MNDSEYKDIKDGKRVIFKGKLKVNPRSKNAETADCYITGGSVVIESTEPLRISLDRVDDCNVSTPLPSFGAGMPVVSNSTVILRYLDESGHRRKVEFEMQTFDAGALIVALETARKAPEIARLRQTWRDAWTRKLPFQTPTTAEPTARDKLCADLCTIGLDARMVELGQLQEEVDGDYGGTSLGLIEMRHSPIRLLNVLTKSYHTQYGYEDFYRNVYLVPDSTIFPESTMFREGYETPVRGYGRSVRVKSVPVFGRVVDFRWKAKFVRVGIKSMPTLTGVSVPVKMDSRLIRRINDDVALKDRLIGLEEDVTIRSFADWGWGISTSVKRQPAPFREQWDCYETIAHHLLESELSDFI